MIHLLYSYRSFCRTFVLLEQNIIGQGWARWIRWLPMSFPSVSSTSTIQYIHKYAIKIYTNLFCKIWKPILYVFCRKINMITSWIWARIFTFLSTGKQTFRSKPNNMNVPRIFIRKWIPILALEMSETERFILFSPTSIRLRLSDLRCFNSWRCYVHNQGQWLFFIVGCEETEASGLQNNNRTGVCALLSQAGLTDWFSQQSAKWVAKLASVHGDEAVLGLGDWV